MSNYPTAKAGFTKSGKSLKAVRRYYALLNQNQKQTTDEKDDKLSKRIAVELRTQQDANEKRSRRNDGQPLLAEMPTERSELPSGVILSPKDTGPVFIAPQPPPVGQIATDQTAKSAAQKSVKSAKSTFNQQGTFPLFTLSGDGFCVKIIYFVLGFILGMVVGALIYMVAANSFKNKNVNIKRIDDVIEEDTIDTSAQRLVRALNL